MSGPIDVASIVDGYVEELEVERLPDGKWHPSSYWGCIRKAVYEVRGTPQTNPPDPVSKRRFRIGHILHDFVQTAFAGDPRVLEFYPEFEIEGALNQAGHGDGLARIMVDGDPDFWFVLEAKSQRATSFKYGLNDTHRQQASSYAVAARVSGVYVDDDTAMGQGFGSQTVTPDGKPVPDPAPEGYSTRRRIEPLVDKLKGVMVVYLEKEDLKMKQHWIEYDPAWETEVAEKIAELDLYRADPESLPPRLPMMRGKKHWMCGGAWGSCPLLDKCWKEDGSAVAPKVEGGYEW